MKKLKKINNIVKAFYYIFGTLPLLVTLYMYPLIPKKIPIHYWIDGSINKWGNKNELLIIPVIILLFVYFNPKLFKLNFNYEPEDKITRLNNYFFILILNALVYTTLYISINFHTCLSNFNFYNFFTSSICIIFTFFGNYISISSRKSSFSIKTRYTLESNIIWERTHKFCGSLWVSGSVVFLPFFLFNSGYYLLIISLIMISIFIFFPYIYTHYLHKKYLKGELKEKISSNKIQHSH